MIWTGNLLLHEFQAESRGRLIGGSLRHLQRCGCFSALLIYWSIYFPILIYCHELWALTEEIQVAVMCFFRNIIKYLQSSFLNNWNPALFLCLLISIRCKQTTLHHHISQNKRKTNCGTWITPPMFGASINLSVDTTNRIKTHITLVF